MKSSEASTLFLNCSFFLREEYTAYLEESLHKNHLTHIVTLNAEMIVEAQKNTEFRDAVAQAELKIPDGSSLLWAKEYLEKRHTSRHPGPRAGIHVDVSGFRIPTSPAGYAGRSKPGMTASLIKFLFSKQQPLTGVDSVFTICEAVERKNGSVYLLGGTKAEAQGTANVLQKKYPKLDMHIIDDTTPPNLPLTPLRSKSFAGRRKGGDMFSQYEKLMQLTKLKKLQAPSVLFVALGSPKQTLYIEQNRKRLEQSGIRIAIGVGGAFAMISGILPRAPIFARRHHLEWLWRLILEPKRIKRIWNAVIVFPNIVRGYPH